MNKLKGSFAAKLCAVLLLCVMAAAFFVSALGAAMLYDRGGYRYSREKVLQDAVGIRARNRLYDIGDQIQYGVDPESLLAENSNLRLTVLDAQGRELCSDYQGEETLWQGSVTMDSTAYSVETVSVDGIASETDTVGATAEKPVLAVTPTPHPAGETQIWLVTLHESGEVLRFENSSLYTQWLREWQKENRVTVRGYVLAGLPAQDEFSLLQTQVFRLWSLRWVCLWVLGLSFLAGLLLYIFLLCAAGHRSGTEEIVPSFVEKVPFDVLTVLIGFGIVGCCLPMAELSPDSAPELIVICVCLIGAGLLFLLWSTSTAVRVKRGELLKSCWSIQLLCWCWRTLKRLAAACGKLLRALPLVWKWALGLGALALIDLIWRLGSRYGDAIFGGWLFFWLLLGGASLYAVLAFRRLRLGAKEIAAGNLSAQVEEKYLVADLKDHARDLNHIRDGISSAVEERMKSERFRTELITNVSHDIKTPLTSIVNYVDLLSREEPESETVREYIEVLSRQSERLKKLIEDLIEASKASTGNLPVNWEELELGVLVDQAAGEYSERLSGAGLELITSKPERPVRVQADGRHLWRVFDNLMNNILKYAQPATRVYLDLSRNGDKAEVTFRNISRSRLNYSGEELAERFVRGDGSRSSEGSGLGLSIAMSLVQLQKGEMQLSVDGDLFKVTLRFDSIEA